MTALATNPLAVAGSGPSCLCEQLRADTEGTRRLMRASAMPASVGRQLPAALLGDDLLALLSDALRRAIDLGPAASFVPRVSGPVRAGDGTAHDDRPAVPNGTGEGSGVRDDRPLGADPTSNGARPSARKDDDITSDGWPLRAPTAPDSLERRTATPDDVAVQAVPRSSTEDARGGRARAVARPQPQTVLLTRLREYWHLTNNQLTSSTIVSAVSNAKAEPPAPAPGANDVSSSRSKRLAPVLPLMAAARGTLPALDVWRTSSVAAADDEPGASVSGHSIGAAGRAPAAVGSSLAEQLADLLREQAAQHGIEVP